MAYQRVKTVNFGSSRAGLATVAWSLDGGSTWSTAGVSESPAGSGIYKATIAFPDNFAGTISWKTGQVSGQRFAAEEVNPDGNSEFLTAPIGNPSSGSLAGDIASVKSDTGALGDLGQIVVSGTIDDPSPTQKTFVIRLDGDADVPEATNFVGLWFNFRSGALATAKQAITGYRKLTATTALITVGVAFAAAPSTGDAFSIL